MFHCRCWTARLERMSSTSSIFYVPSSLLSLGERSTKSFLGYYWSSLSRLVVCSSYASVFQWSFDNLSYAAKIDRRQGMNEEQQHHVRRRTKHHRIRNDRWTARGTSLCELERFLVTHSHLKRRSDARSLLAGLTTWALSNRTIVSVLGSSSSSSSSSFGFIRSNSHLFWLTLLLDTLCGVTHLRRTRSGNKPSSYTCRRHGQRRDQWYTAYRLRPVSRTHQVDYPWPSLGRDPRFDRCVGCFHRTDGLCHVSRSILQHEMANTYSVRST